MVIIINSLHAGIFFLTFMSSADLKNKIQDNT